MPGISGEGGYPILSIVYHFSVFFLFSFFFSLSIIGKEKLKTKDIIFILVVSIIYAIFDEFHQSFIPGRNAEIKDTLINNLGSIISMLLYLKIKKIKRINT
ncbi:MAG: VanZ family protein [Nanoarchaeota archaeon]